MEMRLPNIKKKKPKKQEDLGLGTKIGEHGERLMNKDGSFNVERVGASRVSPYLWMMETTWLKFFAALFVFYVVANAVFALFFVLTGVENIDGVRSINFVEDYFSAFFFSVQTFTTVGFGAKNPGTTIADIIASLDALVGLLSVALATGLFFGRVSKPKAEILFSDNAIIAPHMDGKAFMFRIANERDHKIINLKATVVMSWIEHEDNEPKRRYSLLELERSTVALLPLNWTIVHPIDEKSVLKNMDVENLDKCRAEFIIQIEGFDETFNQQVHLNSSYSYMDLLCDVKFAPMFESKHNTTVLDLRKINDVVETH